MVLGGVVMCCDADLLLCHDDELEGRRIAFILYLTSDWSPEDGGEGENELTTRGMEWNHVLFQVLWICLIQMVSAPPSFLFHLAPPLNFSSQPQGSLGQWCVP